MMHSQFIQIHNNNNSKNHKRPKRTHTRERIFDWCSREAKKPFNMQYNGETSFVERKEKQNKAKPDNSESKAIKNWSKWLFFAWNGDDWENGSEVRLGRISQFPFLGSIAMLQEISIEQKWAIEPSTWSNIQCIFSMHIHIDKHMPDLDNELVLACGCVYASQNSAACENVHVECVCVFALLT